LCPSKCHVKGRKPGHHITSIQGTIHIVSYEKGHTSQGSLEELLSSHSPFSFYLRNIINLSTGSSFGLRDWQILVTLSLILQVSRRQSGRPKKWLSQVSTFDYYSCVSYLLGKLKGKGCCNVILMTKLVGIDFLHNVLHTIMLSLSYFPLENALYFNKLRKRRG
jgi:hypothetical protein